MSVKILGEEHMLTAGGYAVSATALEVDGEPRIRIAGVSYVPFRTDGAVFHLKPAEAEDLAQAIVLVTRANFVGKARPKIPVETIKEHRGYCPKCGKCDGLAALLDLAAK